MYLAEQLHEEKNRIGGSLGINGMIVLGNTVLTSIPGADYTLTLPKTLPIDSNHFLSCDKSGQLVWKQEPKYIKEETISKMISSAIKNSVTVVTAVPKIVPVVPDIVPKVTAGKVLIGNSSNKQISIDIVYPKDLKTINYVLTGNVVSFQTSQQDVFICNF